jgi:muramoyltetrapeptide carboxypeptidase
MRTPPRLLKGDLIALASPARSITKKELQEAAKIIKAKGYRCRIDPEVYASDHQFAGNDWLRATHFQRLLDDAEVKAIFCSRGGYGSLRIVDRIDFSPFRRRPKWIVGYSDITVIHAQLQYMGFESIHATMPVNFETNTPEAINSLFDCLEGKRNNHDVEPHPFNREGTAEGLLIGGNLSMFYSLVGSVSFPKTKGNILFIEDLDEYLYHIDRMMLSLKRADIFRGLAGLVVGGMSDMNDNTVPFGKSAEEIIREHIAEYDFPVCFAFPAGHLANNQALVMGRQHELNITKIKAELRNK